MSNTDNDLGNDGGGEYTVGRLGLLMAQEHHCRMDIFTFPQSSRGYILCIDLQPIGHAKDLAELIKLIAVELREMAKATITPPPTEPQQGKEVKPQVQPSPQPQRIMSPKQRLEAELQQFMSGKSNTFESDPLAGLTGEGGDEGEV